MVAKGGRGDADCDWAIMAVDPGGTSGVAMGTFIRHKTLTETLLEAVGAGRVSAAEVVGDPVTQARLIADQYRRWRMEARWDGVKAARIWLVIEDFQLRQRTVDLSPVEVTAGLLALVPEGLIERQSPGDAKRKATAERLKVWGLYGLGRGGGDHKRDALRHMALKLDKLLG